MAQEVTIPLGFRFYPTDEEVIRMVGCLEEGEGEGLLYGIGGEVIEADPFGEDEPWELFARYGKETEKVVYFATTLKRKFHKGTKICRTVGRTRGSWASQNNFPVKNGNRRRHNNNNIIGWKRSLRYENKSNSSQTGQWLMTEFNLRQEAKPNDLVICKIQNRKKDEQEHVPSSSTLLDNNQLFIQQQQSPATVVDGSTTEDANYYNQHDLGNAAAMSKPVVEYNGNNDNGLLHLPGETITSTVGDECYYTTTTKEDANANLSNYYYNYDDQLILDSRQSTMRPVVPMDYDHRRNNINNNDEEFHQAETLISPSTKDANINNNDQEFHQAETLISPSTKDANYYNQHDLANAVATEKPLVENYGNNENGLLHLPGETITSTVGDDYYHTTTKEDANANLNNYHYNYDDQLILDSGWAMARTVVTMDYDHHGNSINNDQELHQAETLISPSTKDANYYNQHDLANAVATAKPLVENYGSNENGLFHLPGETITSTVGDECYYTTTKEDANANLNNYHYNYDDQLILDSGRAVARTVVPMDYDNDHRNNINDNETSTAKDDDDAANLYYYPNEVEVNHHDDQPPILDNGAGAQPKPAVVCDDNVKVKLLEEVLMADRDEAERTLLDIDGFAKQLMEGAEDDLLMEDSENIPMLPGPDPFTENYLLC